jgi:hypothetical protein
MTISFEVLIPIILENCFFIVIMMHIVTNKLWVMFTKIVIKTFLVDVCASILKHAFNVNRVDFAGFVAVASRNEEKVKCNALFRLDQI